MNTNKPKVIDRFINLNHYDSEDKIKNYLDILKKLFIIVLLILLSVLFIIRGIEERGIEVSFEKKNVLQIPKFSITPLKTNFSGPIQLNRIQCSFDGNEILDLLILDGQYYYIENKVDESYFQVINNTFMVENEKFKIIPNVPTMFILTFFRPPPQNNETYDDISIELKIRDTFQVTLVNRSVGFGISKEITVDRNGKENAFFKQTSSYFKTPTFGQSGTNYIRYIIYYYMMSDVVQIEREQTNLDVAINILTDIGSVVSTVVMVVTLVFHRGITRILIQKKTGWFDNDIRQTIIHYSDHLNKSNIISNELKTIDIKE